MSQVLRVAEGDPRGRAREAEQTIWSLSRSSNVFAVETPDRRIADLYGVAPGDPVTLSAVALLLLLVATAASAGPALRASHLEPHVALRE